MDKKPNSFCKINVVKRLGEYGITLPNSLVLAFYQIESIAPTIVTMCGNELTLVGMGGESMVALWRGSLLQCGVWQGSLDATGCPHKERTLE